MFKIFNNLFHFEALRHEINVYKRNVLKPKTISYEPEYGHKKYSRKCINWLNSLMIKDDTVKIRHARNGGEVKIGKYFVDGYDKDTDTIYRIRWMLVSFMSSMYQR